MSRIGKAIEIEGIFSGCQELGLGRGMGNDLGVKGFFLDDGNVQKLENGEIIESYTLHG